MSAERTVRPVRADEVTTLRGFLDYQRDTLRMKTSGLDQEQLARSLAPSTMTLGGLVKHLTAVESGWFHESFAGGTLMPPFDNAPWEDDDDWEWHTAGDHTPEELRSMFDDSVSRSDRVLDEALARGGLDQESDEVDEKVGRFSLRWIIVHMIEEYARHNGHADLIRESIDGSTGQ